MIGMEELANQLSNEIDDICGRYYNYKEENVLERSRGLIDDIRQFCAYFLQGNIFGIEEGEYEGFQRYVVQVLEDYIEAAKQRDIVLMLDTLDYGLRELLNIYIDVDDEEESHE